MIPVPSNELMEKLEKIHRAFETDPRILVFIGKMASGKTSIVNYLSTYCGFNKVLSYTTRRKRSQEKDGLDYHFVSVETFEDMLANGEFLETTSYPGNRYYGTTVESLTSVFDPVIILNPAGVREILHYSPIKPIVFYIVRDDNERYISAINRGDDIVEIALRSNRDDADFRSVGWDVDFVVPNVSNISETVEEIIDDVYNVLFAEREER